MSFATIIGIIGGIGLFVGAIILSTDNFLMFLDLPSFIMVIGGTFAATFVSYEPRYVFLAIKLIGRLVFAPKVARNILTAEVGRIIKWGYTVQKNGIPALEAESKKASRADKFIGFGMDMVISGYTGQEVREILHNTIETSFVRNTIQAKILRDIAATSPAFGMIGTLIGLIIMLDGMGGDPSELGAGLAVALLTTLYGVLFARMIFLPAANKIQQREEIVRFRNYLVAEGLCLLADRKSPRYIQDRMNSFLDPAIHYNLDKMMKRG
jgi:chemotaxis protein MotA